MPALVCDGCGRPATAAHIAERIARLEWVTQFRPIHIQALFVAESPSASKEDDYSLLLDALEISASEPTTPSDPAELKQQQLRLRLTEFQRRGFYLAFLMECPLDASGLLASHEQKPWQSGSAELWDRFAPILARRIQSSYRPKQIVPLYGATSRIVPALQSVGLGDKLVLDHGAPFELSSSAGRTNADFLAFSVHWQAAGGGG